jgi:hypothetical protein
LEHLTAPPATLTTEVIRALLPLLKVGAGGRTGGYTPERAVELAELASRDMGEFRAEILKKAERKAQRRSQKLRADVSASTVRGDKSRRGVKP